MLLAKSKPKYPLNKHLIDTDRAACAIFTERILENWCRFFRTEPEPFLLHVRVAALFHDIGKANEEFQKICGENKKFTQTLRHEWLSALILHLPTMRLWLSKASHLDFEIVVAAVLGHHMKANDQWAETCQTSVRDLYLEGLRSEDIAKVLQKIQYLLAIETTAPILPETWKWSDPQWTASRKDGRLRSKKKFRDAIRRKENRDRRSLHLAVKAGVVVADTAASGIIREQQSLQQPISKWVKEQLHRNTLTVEDLDRDILHPAYAKIAERNERPFDFERDLFDFQKNAQFLAERALLRAGCGRGKTLAAYLWMRGVIEREKYKVGRVLFLYPTRATATEGFNDYVKAAPESDAGLYHGTSDYELEKLYESPNDSSHERRDFRTNDRLFALGLWGKRYLSATVDRFLAFLSFNYGATVLLPMLADAAVVLDEIHAYDPRMFKQVIAFLDAFDIPVLCMTATLPKVRREQLEALHLELYPTNPEELKDLADEEERDRYHIQVCDRKTAKEAAITAYRDGEKRVLWVVNTVQRCQDMARELDDTLKDLDERDVLCYHSRFKLIHRQQRHDEVVKQFKQRDKRAIAVTTQVCEMSLDLDADVLITEIAPCSALVQRFGRSNRKGKLDNSEIYVYHPEDAKSSKPYDGEQLQKANEFLDEIISDKEGYTSQKNLAEKLEIYGDLEIESDRTAPFLTGGYYASSEPFRDIESWTHDCILKKDFKEAVQRVEKKNSKWRELVLPVPNYIEMQEISADSRMLKYLRIAPDENYSEEFGFEAS